jgi:GT2 family glycosyltransferase
MQSLRRRDPRIRYYRNEVNIGSAPNYEKVFRLARDEFFKWHAHDDLLLPGFLRRCFEVIDAAPPSLVLLIGMIACWLKSRP